MQKDEDAVLKSGLVPKTVERDLQSFSAEVSLNGRYLHLYSTDAVKKLRENVKSCSKRFVREVLVLKGQFENSSSQKMDATIERIKNEIKSKYTDVEAQTFVQACERKFLLFKDSKGKLEKHFDFFPFKT